VRYLTPVGPIRFDVAVPVDRRKDVDDAYQLYISIGQAF
jgi:translocation and assembly module TamA